MRAFAPLVITLLLLAGCGGEDGGSTAGNPVDRGFVAEMVPHHRGAIEMAQIARGRAESAFVRDLAGEILRTQEEEIERMRRIDARLAEAGVERGSLGMSMTQMDAGELRAADPFDPAFVRAMTPHHEEAVEMARMQLERGRDPELKRIARAIIAAQQREIAAMRAFLAER